MEPSSRPFIARFTPPSSLDSHRRTNRPSTHIKRVAKLPPTPPITAAAASSKANRDLQKFKVNNLVLPQAAIAVDESTTDHVPLSVDALSDLASNLAITPELVAKDHLPGILQRHGPLASRQIVAHLGQALPGFARLSSSKARQVVTQALHTSPDPSSTSARYVFYTEDGMGLWNCRPFAPTPTSHADLATSLIQAMDIDSSPPRPTSHPMSPLSPIHEQRPTSSLRSVGDALDGMSMSDHDAVHDMSTDDDVMSSGDETDVEDWAAIGVRGMLASVPAATTNTSRINYNDLAISGREYNRRFSSAAHGSRRPSRSTLTKPAFRRQSSRKTTPAIAIAVATRPAQVFDAMDARSPEERDAVEALLRMGSSHCSHSTP